MASTHSSHWRRWLRTAAFASALTLAPAAMAFPERGQSLPHFAGQDLRGETFDSTGLGGRPTLMVAITDRGAAKTMSEWFKRGTGLLPKDVRRISVVSLHLPFFMPIGAVRNTARSHIPQTLWKDVLLDGGNIGDTLAIGKVNQPVAMAVAPDGRVMASAVGGPDAPGADAVWKALGAEQNGGPEQATREMSAPK